MAELPSPTQPRSRKKSSYCPAIPRDPSVAAADPRRSRNVKVKALEIDKGLGIQVTRSSRTIECGAGNVPIPGRSAFRGTVRGTLGS